MSNDFITNNEMHQMLNRIGSYLVKNALQVVTKSVYTSIDGRSADLATVQNALFNYRNDFTDDNLTSQYALTAIMYNSDNLPNYVILKDGTKLSESTYTDMANRFNNWVEEKGSEPNIIYIKGQSSNCTGPRYVSSPHYLDSGCSYLGQTNGYMCGPHSLRQIFKKFGITKYSEATIAGYASTTTSGTSHAGLETAIAKIASLEGIKLKVEWKNFSELGSNLDERFKKLGQIMCNPDKGVFCHIGYQNGGTSATGEIYGHYEVLDRVNVNTRYVRALNSLGNYCKSPCYCGHLQDRTFNLQSKFLANISQKSICIITKV